VNIQDGDLMGWEGGEEPGGSAKSSNWGSTTGKDKGIELRSLEKQQKWEGGDREAHRGGREGDL